jgi:hypothetical protein
MTNVTRETDPGGHAIRLRGGWEHHSPAEGIFLSKRFSLPIRWMNGRAGLLILTRRFGRPPYDSACEALWLRMDQVPGVRSLHLNGQPLAQISPERSRYDIPLPELLERNQLEIEVDVEEAALRSAPCGGDWGVISLVVRSTDACP